MISCVIPHFYAKRLTNLQPIVNSLTGVDEVVIWDNDISNPVPEIAGARVIHTYHNWGCQGRFKAVSYVSANKPEDYLLFHDNDLITHPGSVKHLLSMSESYPDRIITVTGERRYYAPMKKQIDISRGRFELVPRWIVDDLLQFWKNDDESLHDDIWFSTRGYHRGFPVQFCSVRWRNLTDDVGFWLETPNWELTRQRVFNHLMGVVPCL
jgi:GT2 family glycosyltransferase